MYIRMVRKFLWYPLTLNGETRWLKTTEWFETRLDNDELNNWIPVRWVFAQ